jgi:hypothetical protein
MMTMAFLKSLSKAPSIGWGEIGVRARNWFAHGFAAATRQPDQDHPTSIAGLIGF